MSRNFLKGCKAKTINLRCGRISSKYAVRILLLKVLIEFQVIETYASFERTVELCNTALSKWHLKSKLG